MLPVTVVPYVAAIIRRPVPPMAAMVKVWATSPYNNLRISTPECEYGYYNHYHYFKVFHFLFFD